MKAEEKAIELVQKFENLNSMKMSDDSKIEYPTAKLCAIIAVEEIIKTVNMCISYHNEETHVDFWSEVKQEIIEL